MPANRLYEIPVVPMTPESFSDCGELIDAPERPAERRITPSGFDYDGEMTASIIWQPHSPAQFTRLERHFGVTQCFVQLSGPPAVVCAAPPTDDDPHSIPKPAEVRAFRIDPEKGYAFKRGTWHSLDRFVLAAPGATFIILNSDPNPTQIVDYELGRSRRYADLDVDPNPTEIEHSGDFGVTFALSS